MPLAIFWQLRRRVHTSFLIAYFCAGFITGIGLARVVPPGLFLSWAWCAVSIAMAAVGLWRGCRWVIGLVIIAGTVGGLWRGSLVGADTAAYTGLYGRTLSVYGHVRDDPDTSADGSMVLKLDGVRIDGRAYSGVVWASTAGRDVKRSDDVQVTGKLGGGFGTFIATMYRARIASVTRVAGADPARDVRDWFAVQIRRAIPEPAASLGIGYLVGQKSALPADLAAAFVTTGLTQAVVASGYNLTILVRLARRLFKRYSKYAAMLAAVAMIAGFMAVTGLSPSMTRAGLVSGVSLLAWYYGRTVHPLVLLLFAAAATLAYNPSYAWGDLGWALSFSAFAAVMIAAPLLHRYFFGEAPPGLVRGLLVETVAATIVTLPILVFAFGSFSNVSLPASLLVLPLIPLAMLLTFIAGVGAAIVPPLAWLFGLPASWLLGFSSNVALYFAGLSWATSHLSMPPWVFVTTYVAMAAACVYLRQVTRLKLASVSVI